MGRFILDILLIFKIDLKKLKIKKSTCRYLTHGIKTIN